PSELEQLLMHMLEPDPNQRLSFAVDAADKLASMLGKRGTSRGQRKPPLQLLRSSFAGRDRTLSELSELLEQARAKRGGRVFLTGESGVGKTRTLIELSARASRMGFRVISGQCAESFSHAGLGAARGRLMGLFGRVFALVAS